MLKRFSEIGMNDVSICGGKGASLGEMKNAGFPIPDGFVLTTKGFGVKSSMWEKEVLAAFDKLNTKFVAVRSSGTKEDGVDDSFAGQFDTYLFVTRENLIEKIKECHESVKSERILSYCKYKGIDNDSIKVAVVVQKMVNSDSAGVCFTVNPVTGNRDEIMIEAGYGVGEAVVSGIITPDNYIVSKKTKEVEKTLSRQEKKLVLGKKGGTEEILIPEKEQENQKLSDKHIQELAELAIKIEKHYGKPMDTERAVENGKLFMLQARPITTLGEDCDNKHGKRYEKYPAGDFNTSFISNYAVTLGYTKYPKLLGLPMCDGPHVVRNGDLEYIFDMSTRDACENSFVEKMKEDFSFVDDLINKMIEQGKDLCERTELRVNENLLKKLSNKELLNILKEFTDYQSDLYAIGTSINFIGYGENNYITKELKKIFQNKKIKERDIDKLLTCFTYPAKESFSEKQEISLLEIISKYEKKYNSSFIKDIKNKDIEYFKKEYADFYKDLNNHTKKFAWIYYGFVGPLSTIDNFFDDIKTIVNENNNIDKKLQDKKAERLNNDEQKKVWLEKLNPNSYEKLLLKTAGKIVRAKPTRKDYQSYSYSLLEPVIMEISKRLNVEKSVVWKTPFTELETLLGIKKNNIPLVGFENLYICVPTKNGVQILSGDDAQKFYDENVYRQDYEDDKSGSIKGNSAFHGKSKGVVKIINKKEDMQKMCKGDILVSVATSPSIIPAMKLASGIVTDSGGLTCHAAIVSRELAIPCIVGTKIANQVLKDGDLVEVDADNGIVKILGSENNELEVKIGNKTFTPKFRINPEVYFNYQAYPFFTSIFGKCCSHEETQWTTPCYYVTEFNGDNNTAVQYCQGSFIEKGYNMIDNLLTGGEEARNFLEKQDKIILKCFDDCEKYIKKGDDNFLKIWDEIGTAFSGGWHIFNFSHAMQDYLDKIKEKNNKLYDSLSANITAPTKSFVNQADDYLKDLIKKYPSDFDMVYTLFTDKYGRFQNSYLGVNKNITKKWLKDYYKKLKDGKQSIGKVDKLQVPGKYKSLIETASKAICYQDNKKRLGLISYAIMDKWLRSVSDNTKIKFEDLLRLTVEEILSYDLNSKEGIKAIKDRIGKYKEDKKRRGIMTDKGYIDIDEKFWLSVVDLNNTRSNGNTIKGIIGNKGKVIGKVKVILSIKKDAKKIEDGDILVTGMTRPEFVPIMRKASAFVTDEGGITCHAAIISRELGKPCIIGTRIATQILKDGDLVEVDADNGIVRKLEGNNDILNETNEVVKTNKFSVDEFDYLMGKGNKSDIKIVEDFLNNSDWDVQRFNASPVFVNPTGMGNNYIFQKYFGISYSGFFFNYRGHQREMGYNLKDFDRLWAKLGYSYLQPGFVEDVARDYYKVFSYFEDIFEQIDNGLKIDENNIIKMLKIVNRAQCYSVGIAHSTELINYICTYKLKPLLEEEIGREKFKEIENKIFVADRLSFFAVEQNELYQIAMLKKGDRQEKLLTEHTKKWNRILNSYVGAKELDVEFFKERMEKVLHDGEIKLDLNQRDEIIKSLPINENYKNIIKLINYTTSRHDNRKANILRTIGYFEMILRKLSSISKISFDNLLYLSFSDIDGLNDLKDLINIEQELKQRKKGVIYILNDLKEYIYTGNEYKKLNGILEKLYAEQDVKEIKGSAANMGYVKGKVRICNSMAKIKEFKEGEILVASMTRPEYITAIKKCIAIITDEGGITCHAAIVSRELGKPCIIGTKIATQVLKDGDLVEVDADNGVVRVLERKNDEYDFKVKDGNKIFTPELRARPDHIHFSYQGVPFFSCIFSKCCTTKDTKRTTPANYVCEFNNLETVTQYVVGDFVEKGEDMINNMLQGKNDASIFLKKQDDIVRNCIKKCDKYIKGGNTDFLSIWNEIKLAFEAGCHVINLSYGLQKYLINLKEIDPKLHKTISENIVATKKSFVNQAGDYLKQLLSEYPNDFDKVYDKFMEEYGWFQNSYLGINPIDIKWLKKYSQDLSKTPILNSTKHKINIDKKYIILIKTASDAIIYQDNKKKLGFMSMQIMENWLRDYAKNMEIPFEDLLWLTVEEILDNNIQTIKDKIKEYKHNGKRWGIMTERGYMDISKDFRGKVTELNRPKESIKSFNGITGCKGKYVGKVKIIANIEKDKDKFKKGDILVTSMTRPEFVPLLKEAGGIITNEGGITCHAAIISRELGIPCIIGTKIATQILKDGDLVEVDANNGVVKILENNLNSVDYLKGTDYIRMFHTLNMPFINSYIFNFYYKELGVISIYKDNIWTCYLPKSITEKTLNEGKLIYTDSEKYKSFFEEFEFYKKSIISEYENIMREEKLEAEDVIRFFHNLSSFFSFYSKTEFFYTDSLFSPHQTDEERNNYLKIVEKIKNPGREFFNKLLFGESSVLNQFLNKISKITGIGKRWLNLSIPEEIGYYINGGNIDEETLNNRKEGYILKGKLDGVSLLYGDIVNEYSKLFDNYSKNQKVLKGSVANIGKVKGKVKVIKYDYDKFDSLHEIIESMDKGDILVAETTSPELISACQKAGAIITNQGGMMSHAAIVSRELNIPCVVGVNNATEILLDGMLVEVDADNGVVRII